MPSGQETDWAYSITTVTGTHTGQNDSKVTAFTHTHKWTLLTLPASLGYHCAGGN